MIADIPFDESSRLAALRNCAILDSPPEPAFDRVTQLAAKLFEVPIALVSLIDQDRQWFKSRVGLHIPETPRSMAFCAHAILSDSPLIVPDAAADTRFLDNPLVTAPDGIRFYAGVPILSPDGYPLGTLCVIDNAPRFDWQASQTDCLLQLGAIVMDELRLRVQSRHVIDLNRTLNYRAHHDSLTGLPNRSLFESELSKALELSNKEQQTAVFFIDLDQFKVVNDRCGHHVGDRFLVRIADRLRGCIGSRGLLARLGGDEFTVVLENVTDLNEVSALAHALLESLKAPLQIDGVELYASASIGISLSPSDGDDTATLMQNADIAMYAAKKSGSNCIHFATRDMSEQLIRSHTIETYLHRALAENRFRLVYQPQFTFRGEIIGLEALIRLDHPTLGPVSPSEFIPIAESNGLIVEIGNWVLSEACAQASRWNALGVPIRVAVNVSTHQLTKPGFVTGLAQILRGANLSSHLLEVEITETAAMENLDNCRQVLSEVLALGIKTSMDDFGAGYSSIRYLRRLPLQTVKIDRGFIDDLTPDDFRSLELVRGIMVIAHALGLKVVAEGVETEWQRRVLQEMDCDFVQGFLFSKPLTPDKIQDLLFDEAKSKSLFRFRAPNPAASPIQTHLQSVA